eukprot:m.110097 g.110097  ORF g.110097 m.110097 type:complete len:365 (+) comp9329_c0_seq1:1264-2358(+)
MRHLDEAITLRLGNGRMKLGAECLEIIQNRQLKIAKASMGNGQCPFRGIDHSLERKRHGLELGKAAKGRGTAACGKHEELHAHLVGHLSDNFPKPHDNVRILVLERVADLCVAAPVMHVNLDAPIEHELEILRRKGAAHILANKLLEPLVERLELSLDLCIAESTCVEADVLVAVAVVDVNVRTTRNKLDVRAPIGRGDGSRKGQREIGNVRGVVDKLQIVVLLWKQNAEVGSLRLLTKHGLVDNGAEAGRDSVVVNKCMPHQAAQEVEEIAAVGHILGLGRWVCDTSARDNAKELVAGLDKGLDNKLKPFSRESAIVLANFTVKADFQRPDPVVESLRAELGKGVLQDGLATNADDIWIELAQ